MKPIEIDPDTAAAKSSAARQRLAGTLAELQARLSPKALARDAVQELKETGQELAREGVDVVKRHPLTLAGAATGIVLFLLRRPLGRLAQRTSNATASTVASLTIKRPPRRKNPRRKEQPDTKGTSK